MMPVPQLTLDNVPFSAGHMPTSDWIESEGAKVIAAVDAAQKNGPCLVYDTSAMRPAVVVMAFAEVKKKQLPMHPRLNSSSGSSVAPSDLEEGIAHSGHGGALAVVFKTFFDKWTFKMFAMQAVANSNSGCSDFKLSGTFSEEDFALLASFGIKAFIDVGLEGPAASSESIFFSASSSQVCITETTPPAPSPHMQRQ